SHPFVGIQELPGNRSWSKLIDKLLENDRFKDMFRRRLQTLVDEVLLGSEIDDSIDLMEVALGNDAVLDKNKWGQFGQQQTLAQALGVLKNDYLIPRRTHLSVTHLAANVGTYPTPQTSSALLPGPLMFVPSIAFDDFENSPSSGNQAEEFLELKNSGSESVDMSGWTLSGGVDFTFLPGTIIESNGSLYVSPAVTAFRTRFSSPSGGEGLNVEGDYDGQISTRGETISLHDADGMLIAVVTTPDNSSLAQQYLRITELHFSPTGGKEFEFIEVRNIGPNPLDLTGVQFTDGVEASLSGSLAPGEYGLIVANPGNFPGLKIVGTYTGALNNGGEQLTLRDANGENILSFDYEGDWFSPARSGGYSLDVLNENADWSSWDDQFSWALSSEAGGSPGVANPLPHSNAYASWSRGYFSEAELADPAVSGPLADASGDGVSNLMKYAFGVDPKKQGGNGDVSVEIDGESVTLNFSRLEKTPDITVTVDVSSDLVDWSTQASLTEATSNADGTEDVIFESPFVVSARDQQFLRIRVIQNP
ncbi:MAG: lamin tail domain-containing protein, partial [Akkermansiaceae bacterium]|nr:lamin tail domain-containing protein [Akkermansiaceae bacterium]